MRQFVEARCGIRLSRSACLRYLHRLGFVYKRPKKRLLKADEATRAAFIEQYAALLAEVRAICEPLGAQPALARAGALAARLDEGRP